MNKLKINSGLLKITAYILAAAIFVSVILCAPITLLSAETDKPFITRFGERIDSLLIEDDQKAVLKAESSLGDGVGYCWQLRDPENSERWINISGIYSGTLSVSYALVGSMLTDSGNTALRCVLTQNDATYYTDPVDVSVSFSVREEQTLSYPVTYSPVMYALSPMAENGESEELSTYTIVINYLFDNNAIAFQPYGASIAKNSNFYAEVESPKVVGYSPFRRVGEDYVDASVVVLDFKNIQSDITVNVIYEPALVDFFIHHHKQNLYGDDYSLHADMITESQALTGSTVGDGLALTEEQLPGFRALEYEHLTVAADGSTVIEIRYDRNYYLVDFDMNGGYGTEPVYTRYETPIGANDPIRHGYVFDGWELVSYGENPPTAEQASMYDISDGKTINVPNANLKYKARWITQETTYTMVFWRENADDNGYSYWDYLPDIPAMSGSVVSASDRISEVPTVSDEKYFTFNPAHSDKNVIVEGDGSTVVNVYYTRNYYTLTYKATGLCVLEEDHVHTDDCKEIICGLGHTHNDSCNPQLICTEPEHTEHTAECVICDKTEHIHGEINCECNKTEHTHSKQCWTKVGDPQTSVSGAPNVAEDGQIYMRRVWLTRYYYIYIKGVWYSYSGSNVSSGDYVDPICGFSSEHTHGTDCSCSKEEHRHNTDCFNDEIHVHNEDCYKYSCDTVNHIHTDECYRTVCGISAHTHNDNCLKSNQTNVVKTVYRKYDQSLADVWPVTDENGVAYVDGQRWKPTGSSLYSQVLVYLSTMPGESFTFTVDESKYDPYTMNYYLQVLPGEDYTKTYGGKNYALHHSIKASYNYVTEKEDFFDIYGFTQYDSDPGFNSSGQIDINSGDLTVDFYYTRNTNHTLTFYNYDDTVNDRDEYGIMYDLPLKEYYFEPDYPATVEPNSLTFAGWYSSPGCFDGTEVNWNTITMPNGNTQLFAKWVPITHSVKIYLDAKLNKQLGETQVISHNSFAHEPASEEVVNGDYVFQGWFYWDNISNSEKAFVFTGIPIKKDMEIYAKWSSHVSVEYRIQYLLQGTDKPIADPTEGSSIAGHNKTFEAKAGSQLYEGYQTGYYPLFNSHTITMSVDGTREFIFYYVYKESVPYSVEYVDLATGQPLLETKRVENNNLSVVTETFEKIDGMMPDAYQKRLVLSANEENKITFYYNSDSVHAYYRIVHYIQNISGSDFREYRSEEKIGEIGEICTVPAITLTGFSFQPELTKINNVVSPSDNDSVSAQLGTEGLLIELYYVRNTVEYHIKYVESGTNKEIIPTQTYDGVFGEQVAAYYHDLSYKGYVLIGESLKTLVLSTNSENNLITFYYQEKTVSIKYEVVGPEGSATLSRSTENVKTITGEPEGSMPIYVADGFLFVGWYTDAFCKTEVDPSMVDSSTNLISPKKDNDEVWTDGTVFYAKVIALTTELTITTHSALNRDEQTFIFLVSGKKGTDTEGTNITVTVHGNSSVTISDIPTGDYTITELSGWSWRYEALAPSIAITLEYNNNTNTVVFSHTRKNAKWLDGNTSRNNLF